MHMWLLYRLYWLLCCPARTLLVVAPRPGAAAEVVIALVGALGVTLSGVGLVNHHLANLRKGKSKQGGAMPGGWDREMGQSRRKEASSGRWVGERAGGCAAPVRGCMAAAAWMLAPFTPWTAHQKGAPVAVVVAGLLRHRPHVVQLDCKEGEHSAEGKHVELCASGQRFGYGCTAEL